jgi:hypothetical protein
LRLTFFSAGRSWLALYEKVTFLNSIIGVRSSMRFYWVTFKHGGWMAENLDFFTPSIL